MTNEELKGRTGLFAKEELVGLFHCWDADGVAQWILLDRELVNDYEIRSRYGETELKCFDGEEWVDVDLEEWLLVDSLTQQNIEEIKPLEQPVKALSTLPETLSLKLTPKRVEEAFIKGEKSYFEGSAEPRVQGPLREGWHSARERNSLRNSKLQDAIAQWSE